jgi:RNA polymerase sigma-70 factor (ECF subfamily)
VSSFEDSIVISSIASGEKPLLAIPREEFARFHEATVRSLRGYLVRVTGSQNLAEDLAQESYLRLLRSGLTPDATHEHRRSYLFRIATNLTTDHFRAGPMDEELPSELPGGTANNSLDRQEDVQRALREVSHHDRALLWLAYVEQLSHREIAEVVSVKESSVRGLLLRARHRLGAILEKKGLRP